MKRNHLLMILALSLSLVLFIGAFSPTTVVRADGQDPIPPQEAPQPPDSINAMVPSFDGDLDAAAATEGSGTTDVLDIINLLLIVT